VLLVSSSIPIILVLSHLGTGGAGADPVIKRTAQRYRCRFTDGGMLDIDGPELERLHRESLAIVVWNG
jgi:hypothetical protein